MQLCLEKSHTSSCLYTSAIRLETGFALVPFLVLQGNYKQNKTPSISVFISFHIYLLQASYSLCLQCPVSTQLNGT